MMSEHMVVAVEQRPSSNATTTTLDWNSFLFPDTQATTTCVAESTAPTPTMATSIETPASSSSSTTSPASMRSSSMSSKSSVVSRTSRSSKPITAPSQPHFFPSHTSAATTTDMCRECDTPPTTAAATTTMMCEPCFLAPCPVAGPSTVPHNNETCHECWARLMAAVPPPSVTLAAKDDEDILTACDVEGCEVAALACCFDAEHTTSTAHPSPTDGVIVCAEDGCLEGDSVCCADDICDAEPCEPCASVMCDGCVSPTHAPPSPPPSFQTEEFPSAWLSNDDTAAFSSHQHQACSGAHLCQWLGCGLQCDSIEALAHHVNAVHLQPQQQRQPSSEQDHSASVVQQWTASAPFSATSSSAEEAAAFQCLWDTCSLNATSIDDSNAILQHILNAHVVPECAQQHEHDHAHLSAPALAKRKRDPSDDGPVKVNASSSISRTSSHSSLDDEVRRILDSSSECGCAHDATTAHGMHPCRWEGCELAFATHSALTDHITHHHVGSGKAQYECRWQGCTRVDRTFTQKQKVLRHLQTHTGDRPFRCTTCGKRFSEANTLAQHARTHTHERPYVCDHPGCGKAFAVAGSLTIHKRVHTGERPFRCTWPGCDRAFAESSNLTKHARVHTGERPFVCPVRGCGKSFSRPDQVARHRKTHKGEEEHVKVAATATATAVEA